jgi:hypothetical protein
MKTADNKLKALIIAIRKWNPFKENHFSIVLIEEKEKVL